LAIAARKTSMRYAARCRHPSSRFSPSLKNRSSGLDLAGDEVNYAGRTVPVAEERQRSERERRALRRNVQIGIGALAGLLVIAALINAIMRYRASVGARCWLGNRIWNPLPLRPSV
jgi:hypothetical protein